MMQIKVLLVEDEIVVAEEIAADLEKNGLMVTGIALSGEECLQEIVRQMPDLLILDIKIKGSMSGTELCTIINERYGIPVIYLSANTDKNTLDQVLKTQPYAFISKPYHESDLMVAIGLAIQKYNELRMVAMTTEQDSVYVKHGAQYIRIRLEDITYIEAQGSYSVIHTEEREYTISYNLNHFQNTTRQIYLKRIHRSYVINTKKLESFGQGIVVINRKTLPIGKSFQKELMSLFRTL